jgi:hypothetical protein
MFEALKGNNYRIRCTVVLEICYLPSHVYTNNNNTRFLKTMQYETSLAEPEGRGNLHYSLLSY